MTPEERAEKCYNDYCHDTASGTTDVPLLKAQFFNRLAATIREAERAALERAAWEADKRSVCSDGDPNERARAIAAAIRAMIGVPHTGEGD